MTRGYRSGTRAAALRAVEGWDIPTVAPSRRRYGVSMTGNEESTEEATDDRVSIKVDPETARLLRRLCGASYDARSQAGEVGWLVRRRAVELGIPVPPDGAKEHNAKD